MKQGFYFFVKFGSVLIYTLIYLLYLTCIFIKNPLRFYWEKIFYWEKHERFLKNFSVENLETTPSTFLSKFYFENHLSRIINYWGSIFTLYLTWGEFSLVWSLFVFFFFLSFFFFLLFLSVFSLTETNDSHKRFPLPPAHELSFSSSEFLPPLFSRPVYNCQTDSWYDLFSLEIAFSLHFHWCN